MTPIRTHTRTRTYSYTALNGTARHCTATALHGTATALHRTAANAGKQAERNHCLLQ